MSLSEGLSLYCYQTPPAGVVQVRDYGHLVEDLRFTTVAPGGYGDLTATLKVPNARIIPPELVFMANVVLTGQGFYAFQGRWDEPGTVLDTQAGDEFTLSAMGAATCLQDDPDNAAYTAQTVQYIIGQEVSRRSTYLPLDQDLTQFLASAPTSAYSPAFNGKTIEEELNELMPLLGDYQWGVWNHTLNKDAANFPTWQLYGHARDTSTISYTATLDDLDSFQLRPALEYSYNVVQVLYTDQSTDVASSVTVSDSRLGAGGAQGSAPFPRRKLRKDLTAYHITSAEATSIANALLSQYQNGGWKISVDLTRIRNNQYQQIPLWQVRADSNILFPELTAMLTNSASSLSFAPTANVNQFYITQTEYAEQSGQTPKLTLTLDSFYDTAAFQIARLQQPPVKKQNNAKHHHVRRAAGQYETGNCGAVIPANALAGDVYGQAINFKTALSSAPTSITLTARSASNVSGPTAADITDRGFEFQVTVVANGSGVARYYYQTNGA